MPLRVWNGTAWVDAAGVRVWNGTAWVPAAAGRIWNGTAWVDFLDVEGTPALTNHSLSANRTAYNDGESSAGVTLNVQADGSLVRVGSTAYNPTFFAEGDITIDGTSSWSNTPAGTSLILPTTGEWLQDGTPNLWSVRATITSGGVVSSGRTRVGNYGIWQDLSATRQFGIISASTTSQRSVSFSMVFTLELALTSDLSTILASSTISMSTAAITAAGDPP